jgi:hypothetical protein
MWTNLAARKPGGAVAPQAYHVAIGKESGEASGSCQLGLARLAVKLLMRNPAACRIAVNVAKVLSSYGQRWVDRLKIKIDCICKPKSAGLAGPQVSNTIIGKMLGTFRCDHIGITLRTLADQSFTHSGYSLKNHRL